MGRLSVHDDFEVVGGGVALSEVKSHRADIESRVHVETEDRIHPRIFESPGFDQQLGPSHRLLRRLEEQFDCSRKGGLLLNQQSSRTQEDGCVHIVTAGVHLAGDLRRVGDVFIVLDRQGVHIRPQRHDPAVAIPADETENARAAQSIHVLDSHLVE